MDQRTMKIALRKLSEIKPYPGNPRINDDAVAAVAASRLILAKVTGWYDRQACSSTTGEV
jgi:hypothetical protein